MAADDWRVIDERVAATLPESDDLLLALSAQLRVGVDEPIVQGLPASLGRLGQHVEIIAAPRNNPTAWFGFRGGWTSIDLGGRGDRLTHAKLPARLAQGGPILVVNDLTSFDPAHPAIAIGVWAQFAHPFQRLGALMSGQADGLTAEIALAAPSAWYFIAASWRGKPMAVLANDMIAAELIGLAIGQAQADPDRELAGPWEHPLVQRATELSLGVRTPAEITFSAEWLGENRTLAAAFGEFGAAIAARIGIATQPNVSAPGTLQP